MRRVPLLLFTLFLEWKNGNISGHLWYATYTVDNQQRSCYWFSLSTTIPSVYTQGLLPYLWRYRGYSTEYGWVEICFHFFYRSPKSAEKLCITYIQPLYKSALHTFSLSTSLHYIHSASLQVCLEIDCGHSSLQCGISHLGLSSHLGSGAQYINNH